MKNSPAEAAGMKVGDVLLSCEGVTLNSNQDLLDLIQEKKVGDTLSITLWRNGREMEVSVTIAERADLQ